MSEENSPSGKCPCRWVKCPRHGHCEECRRHHQSKKSIPPWCEKKKNPVKDGSR